MTAYGAELLFSRFPSLHQRLVRSDIGCQTTPVHRLTRLYPDYPAGVWVKCDDQSNLYYGGNKPRKLEFLLEQAKQDGNRGVITVGGFGTNHGLATAILCEQQGLDCHLVLFPQPVTEHVKAHLVLFARHGAELHRVDYPVEALVRAASLWGAGRLNRDPLMYIPPGGSNALGALGFVGAALELAEQVREGVMPEPTHLFVPVGSCGTMAGLVAGLRLAGLSTTVVGVRVIDRLTANRRRIAGLSNAVIDLLKRNGASPLPAPIRAGELHLLGDYMGPAYGAVTHPALNAMRAAKRLENIDVEITYSAKCLAALTDWVNSHPNGGPLLWWNTYAGDRWIQQLGEIAVDHVPELFRDLFS